MPDPRPLLLVGAGRLGGAMLDGWLRAGAFPPGSILVRDPAPGPRARAAAGHGVRLSPGDGELAAAGAVVLAVKPQGWREVAAALAPRLAADAVVVSVMAGVRGADLGEAFGGRPVARVMPTTAVAIARGVASVHAADPAARARAHALFDPIAKVVDLEDEALMDAAVGVSGSAPAYLYAFTEARATMESAAALMAETPAASPAELRTEVTSPKGTTEAALDVLLQPDALPALLRRAVAAAARRSRELAGGATGSAPGG